jgi:hypothetical protein
MLASCQLRVIAELPLLLRGSDVRPQRGLRNVRFCPPGQKQTSDTTGTPPARGDLTKDDHLAVLAARCARLARPVPPTPRNSPSRARATVAPSMAVPVGARHPARIQPSLIDGRARPWDAGAVAVGVRTASCGAKSGPVRRRGRARRNRVCAGHVGCGRTRIRTWVGVSRRFYSVQAGLPVGPLPSPHGPDHSP